MRIGTTVQKTLILKDTPCSTAYSASLWHTAWQHKSLSEVQTPFETLLITPKLSSCLDLMLYSYLFILILIFNIQDTRILLRHGASVFYLQIWACADFFLGLLPPAYSGMLWYNIVQVSLLLCLEKKQISPFTIASSDFLYFFSAKRCNQSWNMTNDTK